jgi:flagellar biosynthesis/type III secretory pathway protein FliH
MARVIKAGAGAQTARPARPATRVLAQADVKKVIEKEMYLAKQEAEELLKRAEDERRTLLAEGKQQSAQAREQAMTLGASQAFAAAAEEALRAFRARADRYDEASDDIRILAIEIATKLLGTAPDLGGGDIDRILHHGLAQLRAKRKVRVLVPPGRRAQLQDERPNLMKAVEAQPDVLVEEAADVGLGFARVVTEVGGALCAEDSAMEALAQAVNVRESPRQRGGHSGGITSATHIGQAPTASRGRSAATAEFDDPDRSEVVARPGANNVDDISSVAADVDSGEGDDDDSVPDGLPDLSDLSELPDAAVDEDDDDDATRALPAPLPRPRGGVTARPAPPPPAQPTAAGPRVQAGFAGNRAAATRVLPIDAREELRDQAKRGAARVDLGADDDDDLDLFTDDRPARR